MLSEIVSPWILPEMVSKLPFRALSYRSQIATLVPRRWMRSMIARYRRRKSSTVISSRAAQGGPLTRYVGFGELSSELGSLHSARVAIRCLRWRSDCCSRLLQCWRLPSARRCVPRNVLSVAQGREGVGFG